MPGERSTPVTIVPLTHVGGNATAQEDSLAGADSFGAAGGPRRRWSLMVAVAVVLGTAAAVAGLQTGVDSPTGSDDPGSAGDASAGEDVAVLEDGATAGDEAIPADTEPAVRSQQVFGEPEHPVSGVEPYLATEIRSEGPSEPADICLGTAAARRTALPLRFAGTKPDGVDQLSWSPDCRRVVFRVGRALWVADGDGTSDEPFLTAPHGVSTPAWSPDSERIAFAGSAVVNGERASHIYVVQPDALGLRQVTEGLVLDRDPAWSPDGTRIAFSRRVHATDGPGAGGFDQHLVVVDLATGASQALLAGSEHESAPSWSPDGEFIAYRVDDAAKLLRVADGAVSELLNADVGGKPTWSPDSARVAAWREWTVDSATIIISDLPGRDFGGQQVIALAGLDETSPRVTPTLRWSSDGRRLVFHVVESDNVSWAYSGSVP